MLQKPRVCIVICYTNASMDRLAYEMHEGAGPPMLLIPGAMGTRWNWAMNLDALRRVGSPVIVEPWGHGLSPVPSDDSRYAIAHYVNEFELLRRDLGVERWPVLGQSIGSSFAIHYALACPEVVTSLTITNDVSSLGTPEDRRTLVARRLPWAQELEGPSGRAFLVAHLYSPRRAGPFDVMAAPTRRRAIEAYEACDPVACARLFRITMEGYQVRERFAELSMPLLWVHGTRERRTLELASWAATQLPQLELVEVASGHAVNVEAYRSYNVFVTAFLRAHSV